VFVWGNYTLRLRVSIDTRDTVCDNADMRTVLDLITHVLEAGCVCICAYVCVYVCVCVVFYVSACQLTRETMPTCGGSSGFSTKCCCNTLQHTVTHCNTLQQHIATHFLDSITHILEASFLAHRSQKTRATHTRRAGRKVFEQIGIQMLGWLPLVV